MVRPGAVKSHAAQVSLAAGGTVRHPVTHNDSTSPKSESGFSLVEVLIAITLLVAAVIPLAAILISGVKASENVNVRMSARELAESEMSKIKNTQFSEVGLEGVTTKFIAANNGDQVGPDSGGGGTPATATEAGPMGVTFTVTSDVQKKVDLLPGNPATKLVSISISWPASSSNGSGPINAGSLSISSEIGPTGMIDQPGK